MSKRFIDIHNHTIPLVDDGSNSFEESLEMIQEMINQGITDAILTPHIQSVATKGTIDDKINNFNKLKTLIKEKNLPINIYFGHEVRYVSHLKPKYQELVINNTNYLLMEFSYGNDPDILEVVLNLSALGLKVIIAHVERYRYLNYNKIVDLKLNGALIQVNAKTIYEPFSRGVKKLVHKLLKNKIIDFIATDAHNTTKRPVDLKKAYEFLKDKYDETYLEDIFYNNAKNIIKILK